MMNSTNEMHLQHLNDEKVREYAPAIAFSAVVVFFGILGNAFTVAYYGFKVRRSTPNVIITALSTIDLLTCIVISDEIVQLYFTLTLKNVGGCKLMFFFNHIMVISSFFILLMVAVDRYRRICRHSSRQMSVQTAKKYIFVSIVIAVLLSVRNWFVQEVREVIVYDDTHGINITAFYCTHSKADLLATTHEVFLIIDFLIVIIETGLFAVLYSLISYRLWYVNKRVTLCITVPGAHIQSYKNSTTTVDLSDTQDANDSNPGTPLPPDKDTELPLPGSEPKHSRTKTTPENSTTGSHKTVITSANQIKKTSNQVRHIDRTVTLMMVTITGAFFISALPYFIINLGIKPQSNNSEQELNVGIQIALRTYMFNHAANPYIIGFFNPKFRTFVKSLFCKCCTLRE